MEEGHTRNNDGRGCACAWLNGKVVGMCGAHIDRVRLEYDVYPPRLPCTPDKCHAERRMDPICSALST